MADLAHEGLERTCDGVPAEAIARAVAQWIVRLGADDPAERSAALAGFDAWKRADPRHAAAAAGLEGLLGRLRDLRDASSPRPLRVALDAALPPQRRPRRTAAALIAALALGLSAVLAALVASPGWLFADLRTAAGERQTRTLADGTTVSLGGATAIDVDYDATRRSIRLLRGTVLVDVAHDGERPFVVETADGSLRALGTRFVVERDDDATVLTMIESVVEATARQRSAAAVPVRVGAGERVRITAQGVGPIERIDPGSVLDAWRLRQLVVDNRPLPEVLDAIARERRGVIHYDRASLVGLRVSAVLPLDDSDRALALLAATFPGLSIRTLTPYLVLVDSAGRQR